jgi:hypothetical protein
MLPRGSIRSADSHRTDCRSGEGIRKGSLHWKAPRCSVDVFVQVDRHFELIGIPVLQTRGTTYAAPLDALYSCKIQRLAVIRVTGKSGLEPFFSFRFGITQPVFRWPWLTILPPVIDRTIMPADKLAFRYRR